MKGVNPSGDALWRNPIRGMAACCARTASGHAAAAPPSSDMNSRRSFDQLIGAQQERFRDRQPEPLGGGQIDDEIELDRLFNRKLARLGAAQDLVDVVAGAPK